MANNTDLSLTIDAWAKIVVERWENKITRLRIHHTGDLSKSFAVHVSPRPTAIRIRLNLPSTITASSSIWV